MLLQVPPPAKGIGVYLGASGPDGSYAHKFAYDSFSPEEIASVANELDTVHRAIDKVLGDLKAPNDTTKTQLARWFGGPVSDEDLKKIVQVFQWVQSGLDGKEKIAKMPSFYNSKKASGDDFAVTNRATGVITLYPLFWEQTTGIQTGILFHELTHLFALTEDYGYISREGGAAPSPNYKLNKEQIDLPTAKLLRNADTYAGFLQEFYLNKAKK